MVKILADTQHASLTVHVPRKRLGNRGLGQRVAKDLASSVAHLLKLRSAVSVRHGQDYKDGSRAISCRPQPSIVSRSSRNRPSKKWSPPSISTSFFGSGTDAIRASSFARGPN